MKTLTQALLSYTDKPQIHEFLIDLLTSAECREFDQRRQITEKLNQGISYKDIEQEFRTSSTTIARVAKCLNRKNSGYKSLLEN